MSDFEKAEVKDVQVHTSCADCANVEICKYAEEYSKTLDELRVSDIPVVMHLDVKCRYYINNMHTKEVHPRIAASEEFSKVIKKNF